MVEGWDKEENAFWFSNDKLTNKVLKYITFPDEKYLNEQKYTSKLTVTLCLTNCELWNIPGALNILQVTEGETCKVT